MHNIALIISTSDKSEDLWATLEQTYIKFWSNINFPIYLTTNHKNFDSNLFNSLKVGDEISWSDNLIKSLNMIQYDYILLTFDDLFLVRNVDNTLIETLIRRAMGNKYNYLQFYRSISSGQRLDNLIFNKSNNTRYKNSTIWSLWKKDILLQLLKKEETAWEFEINGNKRSFKHNYFFSTRNNVIPFINGVVKGLWNPLAKKRLHSLGFETSDKRGSLSFIKTVKHKIWDLLFDFLTYLIHKLF